MLATKYEFPLYSGSLNIHNIQVFLLRGLSESLLWLLLWLLQLLLLLDFFPLPFIGGNAGDIHKHFCVHTSIYTGVCCS